MCPNTQVTQAQRIRKALFVVTVVFMCVLSFLYTGESLHADDEYGTVPPYETFASQPAPNADVQPDQEITLTLTITPRVRNYSYMVDLQVVSTVPVPLALVPNSVSASAGTSVNDGRVITWTNSFVTGTFTSPVTISYKMRAISCSSPPPSMTVESVSTLQELPNMAVSGPITRTTDAVSAISFGGQGCGIYMPQLAQIPVFPSLTNGSFDNGSAGWTESPPGLIYQTSAIPASARGGANSANVAWLGGSPGKNVLAQGVDVPAFYSETVRLKFYTFTESGETDCNNDKANVYVNNTLIKNFPLCNGGESNKWEQWVNDIPSSAIVGNRIDLRFESDLNGTRNSNWFVNRIELCKIGTQGC